MVPGLGDLDFASFSRDQIKAYIPNIALVATGEQGLNPLSVCNVLKASLYRICDEVRRGTLEIRFRLRFCYG